MSSSNSNNNKKNKNKKYNYISWYSYLFSLNHLWIKLFLASFLKK